MSRDLSLVYSSVLLDARPPALSVPVLMGQQLSSEPSLLLFVESQEGATSDLGMAYNRARILPHSEEQLGSSLASKVYPSMPSSLSLGPCLLPYLLVLWVWPHPHRASAVMEMLAFFPRRLLSSSLF